MSSATIHASFNAKDLLDTKDELTDSPSSDEHCPYKNDHGPV